MTTMLRPIALLLVAMTSIQYGASLAKSLFPVLGAEGVSAYRLFFAALILLILWRPWRDLPSRGQRRWIALYGLALGAMNLTFYLALERMPLGLAVALEFTGPLAVALLASRKAVDVLWAALAAAGIVLLLPIAPGTDAVDPLGVALSLGAGFFWALYIVLGKRAGADSHAGTVTALGMSAAAVLVIPFGVAHSGTELLEPALLPLGIGVALLSSAIPYSLEMIALKNLPAKTFGILMSLEPAIAALMGLVALGERLSAPQWVAMAFIMIASAGSALSHPTSDPIIPET